MMDATNKVIMGNSTSSGGNDNKTLANTITTSSSDTKIKSNNATEESNKKQELQQQPADAKSDMIQDSSATTSNDANLMSSSKSSDPTVTVTTTTTATVAATTTISTPAPTPTPISSSVISTKPAINVTNNSLLNNTPSNSKDDIPPPPPPAKKTPPKRVRRKKGDQPTPKPEINKNPPPLTATNITIAPTNVAEPQPNAKPKRTRKKKGDPPTAKTDSSKNPPTTIKTDLNKNPPPMTATTISIPPPINVANPQLLSVPMGSNVHLPSLPYYANYDYNATSLTRPSLSRLFTSSASTEIGYSDELSRAFEDLRDNAWSHLSRCVLDQAQQFDIPSLIGTLYTLRSENEKLANKVRDLTLRREQLRTVNARLELPGSSFIPHLSQTSPNFSSVVAGLTNSPRSLSISSPIPAMNNSPIVSGGSYNYLPPANLISGPNTPNCKYSAI